MFKLLITTAIICLTLLNSALSFPCGLPDPSWKKCIKDSDCATVKGTCETQVPVAIKFKLKVKNYYECMAPNIKCLDPKKLEGTDVQKIKCQENRCVQK